MLLRIILYSLIILPFYSATCGLQDQIKAHADSIWHSKNDTIKMLRSIDNSWDYRTLNTDSALYYSDLAIRYSKNLKINNGLAKAYNIRATIYHMRDNIDSSKYYFLQAIKFRSKDNYMGNASTYMNLMNLYSNMGMFEIAFKYLQIAKSLLDSTVKMYGISNIEEAVQLQKKEKKKIKMALDDHLKYDSLFNFYEPLNTYISHYYSIFLNQGDLKFNSKNYRSALEYYNKCLLYIGNYEDDKGRNYYTDDFVIHAFYKKGVAFYELGELDSAVVNFKQAESSSAMRGDLLTHGYSLSYLAMISAAKNDYKRAIELFDQAESDFVSLGKKRAILENRSFQLINTRKQLIKDELKMKLNEFNKFYSQEFRNPHNILKIMYHETNYYVYKSINNIDSAFYHLEILTEIDDSLKTKLYKTRLIEQQELLELNEIKSDLDSKTRSLNMSELEKERVYNTLYFIVVIVILILVIMVIIINNNNKIRRLNKELLKLTTKKNELFSILAHDIRSPITLSSKALRMLKNQDLDENRKELYITQISEAIFRVENLVQSILEWIISQSKSNLLKQEKFNFKDLIEQVLYDLDTRINSKELELKLDLKEHIIDADKLSTSLIINNILLNAIKFSDQGSELLIHFDQNKLVVINTGTQLNSDQLEDISSQGKTYSKIGTAGEKGSGLGLTIINNLSNYNGFKFTIENHSTDSVKSTLII